MKPVNDGVKTISSKIGHSFNHSNNSFVKAVRGNFLKIFFRHQQKDKRRFK